MKHLMHETVSEKHAEAASGLHAILRAESVAFHRRLDSHPHLLRLMAPNLALAEYLDCLRRLQRIHVPMEEAIETFIAQSRLDFDFSPRRKAHLLARDLAHLAGHLPQVSSLVPVRIGDAAELAAALYVVEGSTRGGRHIAARLAQSLGVGSGRGADFFNAYGDRCEALWHALWPFLETIAQEVGQAAIVAAIGRYFSVFEQALDATDADVMACCP